MPVILPGGGGGGNTQSSTLLPQVGTGRRPSGGRGAARFTGTAAELGAGAPAPPFPASSAMVARALAPAAFRRGSARSGALAAAESPSPGPGGAFTYWDLGQCHCPPCNTSICVVICGTIGVMGAVVTILSGGTTVATCTTSDSGCCTVQVPAAGSYTVRVTVGGTVVSSATRALQCGGIATIAIGSSGLVCCGGYAIPQALTLTDAAGSLSFVYDPSYFYPVWYGGHAVTRTSCAVTTPGGICVSGPPSSGPVRICYQMICYAGQAPTFAFQRAWSWVDEPGPLTPIWYQDPSGFTPGSQCASAPPASCGSPLTDTASDGQDPISTSPFVITFTPAPAGGNATSDPVGGSVVIS